MKKALLLGLLIFVSAAAYPQIIARFYYNENWLLTSKDSVVFFRACVFDTTLQSFAGEIKDYTQDGKLVMKGTYKFGKRNGEFIFYFDNGNAESTGMYQNGYRTGIWKYYYPGGAARAEIDYGMLSGSMNISGHRVLSFMDSTGNQLVKNGTGKWTEIYQDSSFPQRIINQGNYKNFQKIGQWTCKLEDGSLIYTEDYDNGILVKGRTTKLSGEEGPSFMPMQNHLLEPYKLGVTEKFSLAKGISIEAYPFLRSKGSFTKGIQGVSTKDEYFTVIEESAYPEGGMANFYRVINQIMKYPVQARRMGIEGRVFVEFVINSDGSLSDIKVAKGIGAGCDEEAVRVVTESQVKCPWHPGMQKGIPVRQRYTLPIIFKLG